MYPAFLYCFGVKISDEQLEAMVQKGIDAIDARYRSRIDNVIFVIRDEPTVEQRKRMKLRRRDSLYGLYEGIPLSARGGEYGGLVLPDTITIFKIPVEKDARSLEEAEELVCETVWHELAHHFGFDEDEVRKRESVRRHKRNT